MPSDTSLPFTFKRVQFSHASVNKAQGQTFQQVDLGLSTPCFSHGMLYVALSRVGSPDRLAVYTIDGTTRNVVYPEALQMHPLNCIVHFTNFNLHNLFLHITACMVLMLPRTCTMHVTDVAKTLLLRHC